jgi:hypothetical protein
MYDSINSNNDDINFTKLSDKIKSDDDSFKFVDVNRHSCSSIVISDNEYNEHKKECQIWDLKAQLNNEKMNKHTEQKQMIKRYEQKMEILTS